MLTVDDRSEHRHSCVVGIGQGFVQDEASDTGRHDWNDFSNCLE